MKLDLAGAVRPVKAAMKEASERAAVRRLNVYLDRIQCRVGCSACCSRMVHVSVAEALVIQEHLAESGRWPEVRAKALAQKPVASGANPVSWFKMNIKCPVLREDGLCGAYEVRPTPCSTHFVESDPAHCDPWSTKSGRFMPVQMNDLHEGFMKALEGLVDGHGILAYRMSMPSALLFAESVRVMTGLSLEEMTNLLRSELR